MAKTLILNVDDMPSKDELTQASNRLLKDCKILSRIRGKDDVEDVDALRRSASFIEMLTKRGKKSLLEGTGAHEANFDASINLVVGLLMEMSDSDLLEVSSGSEPAQKLFGRIRALTKEDS